MTCVATDAATGDVLMVAHMNDEALRKTIASGEAWYFSRSRNALWRKGETSGHDPARGRDAAGLRSGRDLDSRRAAGRGLSHRAAFVLLSQGRRESTVTRDCHSLTRTGSSIRRKVYRK